MAVKPGTSRSAKKKPYALVLCESVPLEANDQTEAHDYAEALCAELGMFFSVSGPVRNGCDIWKHLIDTIPDVIVISLTLPDVNAISLASSLRRMSFGVDIRFFICCPKLDRSIERLCESEGFGGAVEFGAGITETAMYILDKYREYESNKAENSLRSLRDYLDNNFNFSDNAFMRSIKNGLTEAVLEPLGFDPSLRGTRYLECIITLMVLGAPDRLDVLYSYLGDIFKTSAYAVEKAIRYSIEKAWEKGSPYLQFFLFGNSVDASKGKPTNKEFITTAAQHTRDKLRNNKQSYGSETC